MTEEKKQINIDPSMLEIITKTRRKEPKVPKEKIPKFKIRIPEVKHSFKSHALRFIRNKQKSMYDSYNTPPKPIKSPAPISIDTFKTDFDSSIEYLNAVNSNNKHSNNSTNSNSNSKQSHNYTLRVPQSHPQIYNYATPVSISGDIDETNIAIEEPKDVFDSAIPVNISSSTSNAPKYGCLKNGTLPTYRTYSKTLRNTPQSEQERKWNVEPSFSEWMKRNTELRKIQEANIKRQNEKKERENLIEKQKRPQKLKKTIRRTYVVGRSSVQPKVSVLVSNKTIRRDIDIKCNKLKQSTIEEVKRDLTKKGLIKVGTSAPPDILRKMYESVNTLCGDIKNHNSDNLVYNYFNEDTTGS